MSKMSLNLSKERGFTLIEAFVAIAILLIAAVEPLSLTSNSVSNANFAKDQINASYLAQEAIEFIRNKRDTNILNGLTGTNWLSGLSSCKHDMGGDTLQFTSDDVYHFCTFDVADVSATYISCVDGSDTDTVISDDCRPFQLITAGNLKRYGFDSTSPVTSFVRAVTIYETIPGREAEISVIVYWRSGLVERSFVISERIFNWLGYE